MSNSSASSSMSNNGQQLMCYCGYLAKESTAKTELNYGRRFWGCPAYATKKGCNFFMWKDQEFCARASYVIRKLLKDKLRLELDNEKLQQNIERQYEVGTCEEKGQEKFEKQPKCLIRWLMAGLTVLVALGVVFVVTG